MRLSMWKTATDVAKYSRRPSLHLNNDSNLTQARHSVEVSHGPAKSGTASNTRRPTLKKVFPKGGSPYKGSENDPINAEGVLYDLNKL